MPTASTSPPAEVPANPRFVEPPPWQQMFIAEDGSIFYDTDARQSPSKHFAQEQAEHGARLRRLTPIARRTYMTYKRTGVLLPLLAPRPQARPRSSRGPAPIRYKGSRRSGTRSPPSSSDDDPHESESESDLDQAALAASARAEMRAPSKWMQVQGERLQRARRARSEQLTFEGVA